MAEGRSNLAHVLAQLGEHEAAQRQYERAVEIFLEALGPDHPHVAIARGGLARVLLMQGRPAQARVVAELAWARLQRSDLPAVERGDAALTLAEAMWEAGEGEDDRRRARALADGAWKAYAEAGHEDLDARARAWFAERDAN